MSTESATGLTHLDTAAGDPRITVAVITRDRPVSLLRTLDALAALPERPPVIVVDNSRGDGTRTAVRGHPAVAGLLRPAANTGALGRNLAVRHARTPYVAFSDDDSWWEPGSLARAADLLDRHSRLGLLAARTLAADDPLYAVHADSRPTATGLVARLRRGPHRPPPGLPAARQHGPACPRDPQHPVVHLAAPPTAAGAAPHRPSDAHGSPGHRLRARLRPRPRRAAMGAAPARPGAARPGTPAGRAGAGPPNLTRPAVCRLNRARCDTPVENRCVGRGAGAQ